MRLVFPGSLDDGQTSPRTIGAEECAPSNSGDNPVDMLGVAFGATCRQQAG
jgi:hypothetical protein